jgi:predicted transcriptional regulator
MNHNDNIIGKKNLFAIQYGIEQTKKPYIWAYMLLDTGNDDR